jgi:AMP deaminase
LTLRTIGLTLSPGHLSQNSISGSNSPKLVPNLDIEADAEDEDYRREQDASDDGSDETWDGRPAHSSSALPEAALGADETPDASPPEPQEGMLPRDVQEKTAYYDYTSEKQLSQADAKLFYQRSKLDSQQNTGESSWSTSQWGTRQNSPGQSPVIVPKSMGGVLEADQTGMQSSASMASLQSGRNVPQR